MELFDLLVTGQTKNKLLKALWKEGLAASAHQLSLMTDSAYATTYEELELLVKENVVTKAPNGKASLYARNSKFENAAALDALLEVQTKDPASNLVSDQEVMNNLGAYGAPLGNYDEPKTKLTLEETVARAVLLSQKNATVARVLPVTLWLNRDKLNFKKSHYYSQKFNVTRAMGFYLDLTSQLSTDKKFSRESKKYADKRFKKNTSFFTANKQSKFSKQLEDKNTPELAKKWKFTMNMTLDSFATLFKKFAQ